ncbi:cellulose biosynthesis protein BcsQ [Photobacterium sp. Hal280]|uniref:cellulose biosynthesis protein BcsQ n=1 Tax=Photobacterium sp. Hal280 TaxID=3035163 RepID=UPI00301B7199
MKRIGILSLRGGAGATTVTANLAQALVQVQKNVLVVDAVPANLLRLHFGLPLSSVEGWASHMCANTDWQSAGFESPNGVTFLPFGQLSLQNARQFEANRGPYLAEILEALGRVDLGDNQDHWQLVHLAASDLAILEDESFGYFFDAVLVVLTPDAACYSVLQDVSETLTVFNDAPVSAKVRYVLNQYQPETEISRDFMLVMKKELDADMSPVLLHRDIALMDSVANLTTVQQFSPTSQAAKDYQSLAFWCVSQLSAIQCVS